MSKKSVLTEENNKGKFVLMDFDVATDHELPILADIQKTRYGGKKKSRWYIKSI